jgi:hypothetical integral membrane protein (TIGR02206 family)
LTRPADVLHSFHAFTATHAAVLAAVFVGTALACTVGVQRRDTVALRRGERVAGVVVLGLWAAWFGFGLLPANYKSQEALPLHVCDITGLAAPLVLLTRVRLLRALLYFWGLGLSIHALITPTIEEGPLYVAFWLFWFIHVAIIGTAVYDVVVRRYRPTFRDMTVAIAACAIFLCVVIPVNLTLHANYGYVGNTTPDRPTAIDALGAWPLRVYKMFAGVIVLFFAMWFPWWLVGRRAMIGGPAQRGGARE